MAEFFKVEQASNKKYCIVPTGFGFEHIHNTERSCVLEYMYNCYNYDLTNLLRYFIQHFSASIYPQKKYPYFIIYFTYEQDADNCCKELNSRIKI